MQDVAHEMDKEVNPIREAAERTTMVVSRLSDDLAKADTAARQERAHIKVQHQADNLAPKKEMEDARKEAAVGAEAAREHAVRLEAMCKSVATTLSVQGDVILAGDDPHAKAAMMQALVRCKQEELAEEEALAEAALAARQQKQ